MVPTAPGLFSTIRFQPLPSESAVATTRARMSGGVLAENDDPDQVRREC
jgi:hypothetical protein